MLLHLLGIDGVARGDHVETLVHVREEKRGADAGLGVEARASVSVTASSHFEVERTIHAVLLRPEYRR